MIPRDPTSRILHYSSVLHNHSIDGVSLSPHRPSNGVTLEDENPYQVVDPDEKRELERRRRERREGEATKSAAIKEPVFSEEEVSPDTIVLQR